MNCLIIVVNGVRRYSVELCHEMVAAFSSYDREIFQKSKYVRKLIPVKRTTYICIKRGMDNSVFVEKRFNVEIIYF